MGDDCGVAEATCTNAGVLGPFTVASFQELIVRVDAPTVAVAVSLRVTVPTTPVADKPGTLSQRGLHFTSAPGLAMEVWQWKASSGGLLGWIDKNHFDLPVDPTLAQTAGEVPYRGGYVQDSRAPTLYGDISRRSRSAATNARFSRNGCRRTGKRPMPRSARSISNPIKATAKAPGGG